MQTTRFLAGARDGDPDAIAALATRLRPVLMLMARRELPDALRRSYSEEDLVQDVWVILLRSFDKLHTRQGRRTPVLIRYVRSTMSLHVRGILRREIMRAKRADLDTAGWDGLAHPGRQTITRVALREAADLLVDSIESLDEPKRTIVQLCGVEQRSYVEVARVVKMQPDAVRKAYRRALERIASRWPDSMFAELVA